MMNATPARVLAAACSAALDLVLPVACAACGTLGASACTECLAEIESAGPVVLRPGMTALARHEGTAREFVLAYKERGRRDLARPLGAALARALPKAPVTGPSADSTVWLVPVPSRPSAARVRGGAHVAALARSCAQALAADGRPAAVAPALSLSSRVRDAVGLTRAERVANLAGRVRFERCGAPPAGAGVVLVDDVVTTGATLQTCAEVLADAGTDVVAALTLTAALRQD